MKVTYRSPLEKRELCPGKTLSVIPVQAMLHITCERNEPEYDLLCNGSLIDPNTRQISCDGNMELVVVQSSQRYVYAIRPAFPLLSPKYVKNYEQFSYDLARTSRNAVEGIQQGQIKLYAIEQSTRIRNWDDSFYQIDNAFPSLKRICDRPKTHLRSANEVRPIETVKRVGYESIPYLAAHSEDWLARTASGLKPARLFSRIEEEDFHIYENRVVKTLIDSTIGFLRMAEKELRDQQEQIGGILDGSVQLDSFGFDAGFQRAVAELMVSDTRDDSQRIKDLDLIEGHLSRARFLLKRYRSLRRTKLYRYLRGSRPVPNPLKETNILLLDKHYHEAFCLWKALHRVMSAERESGAATREHYATCKDYQLYCATLCEYAAHVLGFDPVSISQGECAYERDSDHVGLKVAQTSEGWVRMTVFDSERRFLDVAQGLIVPIEADNSSSRFSFDGKRVTWPNDIRDSEIDAFCSLFKKTRSKGRQQAEERRNYTQLKQAIQSAQQSYKRPISSSVLILPMAVELTIDSRASFRETMELMSSSILKQYNIDMIIVALPTCNESEQGITNYALFNDQHMGILPLSMFDINSYRRIQNLLYRQILKLDKQSCPNCGNQKANKDNRFKCDVCSGLTITSTKCPNPGCTHTYRYMSFDVRDTTIQKMQSMQSESFFYRDSLYQYKNVVDMRIDSGKVITVCPQCHR